MATLVVIVENTDTRTTHAYRLGRSPVRVGRNPLNDIPLEQGFVSSYHGLLRFDERQIQWVDLGSTNGSMVAGARAEKNVPIPLPEGGEVRIGPLRLRVGHAEAAGAAVETPIAPSPRTLAMQRLAPDAAAAAFAARAKGGAASAAPAPAAPNPSSPITLPDPAAGGQVLTEMAARLLPPAKRPRTREDMHQFATAIAETLAAFATAFVGLRRGLEQLGSELGVRTISGNTPLHAAKDAGEALSYLLDFRADVETRLDELISLYADFGLHQMALLNGVTESVKGLLDRIDPEAASGRAGRSKIWPFRGDDGLQQLVEAFRELRDDDRHLHAALFGEEFARAYAAGSSTQGIEPGRTPRKPTGGFEPL